LPAENWVGAGKGLLTFANKKSWVASPSAQWNGSESIINLPKKQRKAQSCLEKARDVWKNAILTRPFQFLQKRLKKEQKKEKRRKAQSCLALCPVDRMEEHHEKQEMPNSA
jgi:hypothetical protein